MTSVFLAIAIGGSVSALAQTPAILLEACNAMEPASKRLECLRAAAGVRPATATAYGGTPSSSHAAPSTSLPHSANAYKQTAPRATSSQTCYTGPRGGTYTITASGRKNYSGC